MFLIFLERCMTAQIMRYNSASDRHTAANDGAAQLWPSLADDPALWRRANASQLHAALCDVRARTLAVFDAYAAAGSLNVPYSDELNPPLWELGHIGWYQELWIGRNPQRAAGIAYQHDIPRTPSLLAQGDSWYDSSTVPHASRWHLPLLDPQACKAYLDATLEQTLALLAVAGSDDDALYFYRLVLFHEAMHLEAAIYMAQALGMALPQVVALQQMHSQHPDTIKLIAARAVNAWTTSHLSIQKQSWTLGFDQTGFAFDNELGAHSLALASYSIDAQPVSWGQYMAYVEHSGCALPRYVRRAGQAYEQQVFGQWHSMNMDDSAVHISYAQAQAYCQHAGRRLPTEAQWECAAMTQGSAFAWGNVWEWTASTFAPFAGFVAHPYLDYSEPWFNSRPVLRGACSATQPVMRNAKYRNYFMPDRTDIYSGFRTCAL
jgi:gamma-glutamyl hercynylcysteine S-oxide synthase